MQLIRKNRTVYKAVAAGSVPPEIKEVWRQLQSEGVHMDRNQTGGAEHNLPDIRLEDALRCEMPRYGGSVEGDGAGWSYGKVFLPTLQSMKLRQCKIELVSWETSCNQVAKGVVD